tara:strand:+ start:145 stop:690 length:546 start_codon:yes stop_codon:yes gene_type:complete
MRIDTGVIHNPHFYDFNRRFGGGRNLGDIPCGGLPGANELVAYFDTFNDGIHSNIMFNIHRIILHIDNYELPILQARENDYTYQRVRYMLNELSEHDFKTMIQRGEKRYAKANEMRDILQMFVNATSDILRQMVLGEITCDTAEDFVAKLVDFFNNSMENVGQRYEQLTMRIRGYARLIHI